MSARYAGPMLEIFTTLTGWLEMVLEAISGNFWLSLWFIFLIAATEAVFILGLFIPSTPVLPNKPAGFA